MKPLDFPLLTDENIAHEVVLGLRARQRDVRTAADEGLLGHSDIELLARARESGRVILTHDLSFGRLSMFAGTPFVGVVYIRPGHISASFVLEAVDSLLKSSVDVTPPFIALVERRGESVRVRIRSAARS